MTKRDYLTSQELELLLAASHKTRNPERDYAILLLMFRHALRVSELCNLKLGDIRLEAKELWVTRAKGSASGSHPFFNGESDALRAWLEVRTSMDVPAQVDTVFVSEQRNPLNRVSVWYLIQTVAREAGLENVHPHTLRHSCGYKLTNEGNDLRIIQSFMGHKNIASTIRYTAVDVRRFARLF